MKITKKSSKQEKRQIWQNHVKAYSSSNLTQKAYCFQHDISYWSFNSWKRRLKKETVTSQFIEIPRNIKENLGIKQLHSEQLTNFEIILNNGLKIKIPDNFNPIQLKQIIKYAGEIS